MKIGKVLNRSWQIISAHPGAVLGYGFIPLLIASVSFGLLLGPMYTGYCGLIFKLERGEKAGFKELFGYFRLQHWFGGILYQLAIWAAIFAFALVLEMGIVDPRENTELSGRLSEILILSTAALIVDLIVIIWLMARWFLLFPVLVSHQGGTRAAFGIAVETLRQNGGFWPALGLVLIAGAITMVLSMLMSAIGLSFISFIAFIPFLVFMAAAYLETLETSERVNPKL